MLSLNRLTGLACAIAGLLLLRVIIPQEVEAIDDSGVQPATIPKAVAWTLLVVGWFHSVFPTGTATFDKRETARAALFLAIVGGAVTLMSFVGFVFVAPALILLMMLVMGERRWFVLSLAILPIGIWAMLEFWLGRPLP